MHRGDQQVGRIVGERCILLDVAILGLECREEGLGRSLGRNAGLRAQQAFGGFACQLAHFVGAGAVAEGVHHFQAKFLALLDQGATGGVHAAVEDRVRLLALDLGQDGFPVIGLVGSLFARQDLDAGGLEGLLDLVGQAFAIGGGIVDDGNGLGLDFGCEVLGDRRALLVIATDGAKGDLVAVLGDLGISGRAGNHRDAGLVVDFRRRNGDAGIEVADHAGYLGVDQLLRHGGADLGISLVVFTHQLEGDLFAIQGHAPGIGLVDRQAHAVFVVLAQMGDAAGERADMADLHHRRRWFSRFGWLGCLDRRGGLRFFLAATGQGKGGGGGDRAQAPGRN